MKKSVKLLGVLSLSILLLGACGSNKKANESTTTKKKGRVNLICGSSW